MVKIYNCQFCKREYRTIEGLEHHEGICYMNPDRECETCGGSGIEMYSVYRGSVEAGSLEQVGEDRPCTSCEIAKQLGGKHYLD